MSVLQRLISIPSYCYDAWTAVKSRHIGYITWNRKTGEYIREQQPIWKKVKTVMLFNPLTEWLDTTHLMRLYIHDKTVKSGT
jgi:phosphatidylserine decarboxylase